MHYSPANMMIVKGVRASQMDQILNMGIHEMEKDGEVLFDVTKAFDAPDTPDWFYIITRKAMQEYSADYMKLTT